MVDAWASSVKKDGHVDIMRKCFLFFVDIVSSSTRSEVGLQMPLSDK